jgi:tRNA-specific 2-thiouridylase
VHYTLGQRNLGIGGVKGAQEGLAWFVAAKDMANNRLIVVQGHQHPSLFSKALLMTDLSWTSLDGLPPPNGRYAAKTRYRMADAACQFERLPDGRARLVFDDAQWAVTPGQSAVLYDGDVCLGGGVIV